jgi:hypothetical protein
MRDILEKRNIIYNFLVVNVTIDMYVRVFTLIISRTD